MISLQRGLEFAVAVECTRCGVQQTGQHGPSRCSHCGYEVLDVVFDYDAIGRVFPAVLQDRPFRMWRYLELLPLRDPRNIVSLGEGGTPLVLLEKIGKSFDSIRIFAKDERQGPTGSFKDRQASLAVSTMREAGILECVVASTGNVAIAYSAYCARVGVHLWAFLPDGVAAEKVREVALYGSRVTQVPGTYDRAKQMAASFATERGLFLNRGLRSIAARESMKTLAFEICEQLAMYPPARVRDHRSAFRSPDWYVQAVSGGMGPVGVYKGFYELKRMGLIDRIPKIAVVQSEGCAPMIQAWRAKQDVAEAITAPTTKIVTLSTGDPGPAYEILRSILIKHGGTMESVTDDEAFEAVQLLAKAEGISMEPASGVAFAGLWKLIRQGVIAAGEDVVVNCSGHSIPVSEEVLGADTRTLPIGVDGST